MTGISGLDFPAQADSTRVRGRLWVPWRRTGPFFFESWAKSEGSLKEIFLGHLGINRKNLNKTYKTGEFPGISSVFWSFRKVF